MTTVSKPLRGLLDQKWYKHGTWTLDPRFNPVYNQPINRGADVSSFDRSPLVKNLRDATGWRKPSAYHLEKSIQSDWYGEGMYFDNVEAAYDALYFYKGYCSADRMSQFDFTKPTFDENVARRALTEALVKAKQQNVNYAVALAEARKAMTQLEGTLWTFFGAYKAAKKLQWKKVLGILKLPGHSFKASSKRVSDRWLELQYGWLPLLSDASGYYDDLRTGLLRSKQRFSVKRTVLSRLKRSWTVNMGKGLTARYRHTKNSVVGAKVRLDFSLKSDAAALAAKTGLSNPLEVGWELVPFSFVVDWIAPIGNFLSAWDADFGLTFEGGTITRFIRVERRGKLYAAGTRKQSTWYTADFEGRYDYVWMDRSVYNTVPFPLPYYKNPISGLHAANAVALIRGLFK